MLNYKDYDYDFLVAMLVQARAKWDRHIEYYPDEPSTGPVFPALSLHGLAKIALDESLANPTVFTLGNYPDNRATSMLKQRIERERKVFISKLEELLLVTELSINNLYLDLEEKTKAFTEEKRERRNVLRGSLREKADMLRSYYSDLLDTFLFSVPEWSDEEPADPALFGYFGWEIFIPHTLSELEHIPNGIAAWVIFDQKIPVVSGYVPSKLQSIATDIKSSYMGDFNGEPYRVAVCVYRGEDPARMGKCLEKIVNRKRI